MPQISIVLPTFNGGKYIKRSIDSILGQTYQDWELIIVDDCSEDNTPKIVEQYGKNDSRIKIIHNDINKGLPVSLNVGFKYSSGAFLTWTSDDNFYLPQALETMYEYLYLNNDKYMVCADMSIIDSILKKEYEFRSFDETTIYYRNCIGACFLYRRNVLEEIGEYDDELFLVEDYDYWLRIVERYGMVGHIGKILYKYQTHDKSLTATKQKQVSRKKSALRIKHLDLILKNLKKAPNYLCCIYYEFLEIRNDVNVIEKKFFQAVPALKIDMGIEDEDKETIIWGAGNYGERAAEILKERVKYFVDSDISKVGNYKCGVEIISKERFLKIYQKYNILVSVSNEKIFEILNFLYVNGIDRCCTYQKKVASYKLRKE